MPFDYEQWRRDNPLPAGKRLADWNWNAGEPRTVRMIYFLPNDRPYSTDELAACRGLNGEKEAVVEFEYDVSIPLFRRAPVPTVHTLYVRVVDSDGETTQASHTIPISIVAGQSLKMMNHYDSIKEVRTMREQLAAQHSYNVRALFAAARKRAEGR